MTELQEVEFGILKQFIAVCEKLELKYYLVCGSALGAVKYGGFIPWDDDIDVGMFRADYERFLKEAPALMPQHLFLQNYRTEKNFAQIFSKLRNSNTTYIEKSVADMDINHGVYIDIFPLDGYPDNIKEQKKFEFKKRIFELLRVCVYTGKGSFKIKCLIKVLRFFGVHKKASAILKKYDEMISKYDAEKSKIICNHGNWQGKLEYATCEQYGEGDVMKFEGLDVRVPELMMNTLRRNTVTGVPIYRKKKRKDIIIIRLWILTDHIQSI